MPVEGNHARIVAVDLHWRNSATLVLYRWAFRVFVSLDYLPSLLLNDCPRFLLPETDSELLPFVHHLLDADLGLQEILFCALARFLLRFHFV